MDLKRIPHASQSRVARSTKISPRVLLAEDDPEMRELVAAKLRLDGHDVVAVPDGGRLLVRIANAYVGEHAHDAFALIVSDIRMPVCSGLSILEGLRKAHWSTPVILMTAFGDEATRARAATLDAVLFDKPFDVDDLRTAALYLLDRADCASQRSSRR